MGGAAIVWPLDSHSSASRLERRMLRSLLSTLLLAAAGCGPIETTGDDLVVFTDADGFETVEVFDATYDQVAFRSSDDHLLVGQEAFAEWPMDEDYTTPDSGFFRVRFGVEDGEQRAYFTESAAGTVCDIQLNFGELEIFPTDMPVPGG